MVETIIHKRINFSDERELRAITVKPPTQSQVNDINSIPKGYHISVDLDMLIESVIVAPFAPDWIKNLITSILKKFSLNKPVKKSSLDELPPNS